MKKLVAMAALLAAMPVANAADSKGAFTTNAEYRLRYQYNQNPNFTKDESSVSGFVQRFAVDSDFKSGEKFGAHLTLLHNTGLGDATAANPASGNNQTKSGIGTAQNMVLVNQAYGTWMLNDAWSLKFGRGNMALADQSVVGINGWGGTPYSFDGVMANWDHEAVRASIFMVKALDNNSAAGLSTRGNEDPEVNFYGAAFDVKNLPEFLKVVNVHFMKINGDELDSVSKPGRDEMRYGLVVSGDTSNIDYKFDYAANTGKQKTNSVSKDVGGSMMAAEVGYSMPEMMKSRVHVAYHSDTGEKAAAKIEHYDSFFYNKHGASGLMDVVAWGNLTFINAGYAFTPMDQFEVGLHYWMFNRSEDGDVVTGGGNGGVFTGSTGTENTEKAIGNEIDISATKKYDGGLSMTANYGMFMPGAYLKDAASINLKDTYSQLYVQATMTF